MVEKTDQRLADQALGRIISAHIDIKLIPPPCELGETDAAWDIGHNLVQGAMRLMQEAGDREGFKVEITYTLVVY